MEKKLYKSKQDKKLAGVCGGFADYLHIDVTIIRLLWVILTLCASIGLWIYIACALIIPEKPDDDYTIVD